jgi:hypothetical protein
VVESPALFSCELSIKCVAVCNTITGSGVAERWAFFFRTKAMLPQNNDLLKGYETMGEKGGRKTEEI